MGAKIDVVCNMVTKTKQGYNINFTMLDSVVGESDNDRAARHAGRNFDLSNKTKEFAEQFEPGDEYTLEFKPKK